MNVEIIGIVATIFVLLSFMMRDVKRIRAINIIGALLFVFYGFMIDSFSTSLLNSALVIIHTFYLFKMK